MKTAESVWLKKSQDIHERSTVLITMMCFFQGSRQSADVGT